MFLALTDLLSVPVCVSLSPPLPSFTPHSVAKTAIADVVQKKKKAYLFVFLPLDDLFSCVAAFSSGFVQFSQRKPCHNSEFLTGQQLPGQASADQRRINMRDKLSTARRCVFHRAGW